MVCQFVDKREVEIPVIVFGNRLVAVGRHLLTVGVRVFVVSVLAVYSIRTETIPFDRSMTTESGFTTRCDKSTALSATESHSS